MLVRAMTIFYQSTCLEMSPFSPCFAVFYSVLTSVRCLTIVIYPHMSKSLKSKTPQNRLGKPHLRTLHGRTGGAAIFFAIGAPLLGGLAFRAIGITARLPAFWQTRVKSAHRVVRLLAERERGREKAKREGEKGFRWAVSEKTLYHF